MIQKISGFFAYDLCLAVRDELLNGLLLLAAILALCTNRTINLAVVWFQEWQPLCNVVIQEHTSCQDYETNQTNRRRGWAPLFQLEDDTEDPDKDNFDCVEGLTGRSCDTVCNFATSDVVDQSQYPLCQDQCDQLW